MQGANIEEIVKMAQQVAKNIAQDQDEPIDPKNMDMGKVISQVTNSVSKMITPEMIERMSGGSINGDNLNSEEPKNFNSKINFDELPLKNKKQAKIKELEEESDNEYTPLEPRTKDLQFTLNVTLEDLYSGKVKKLAVRRKKILTDGKKKSTVEEKKKISINIEPGMFDEQVITFNGQADEKEGYKTGDIVITLACAEHDEFEREGNNLLIEKTISLAEAYDCKMTITHLDGKEINVISTPINIFGEELECYRKLKGFGMPVFGSDNEYGDLIIKFKVVIPDSITSEKLEILNDIFPKLNEIKNNEEHIHRLEPTTETDFEYSDDESVSGSEDSETDDDESSEEEEEEN